MQAHEFHSGPLPAVGQFRGYDEVTPGAGDRILTMAEGQQRHHQELDMQQENSSFFLAKRAQFFSFILSLAFIALGGLLLLSNKDIAGYSSLGTALLPALASAINQTRKKKPDEAKS